jgi:multidrug transporter EmrE-like cation transporter
MMFLATGLSAATACILYATKKKVNAKLILKRSWYFPVLAGSLNAVLNLFVILLATSTLSPNLIYPVLSIGGLMLTILVSAFIFKEKLRWWQWIGIAVGIVAILLLS